MTIVDVSEINISKLNEDIEFFTQVHPARGGMGMKLKGVSRLVMLDRYAFRDTKLLTLGVTDLVVLTYKEDPKFPKRGYGFVTAIEDDMVTVELDQQFPLEDGTYTLTVHMNKINKPLEIYYEQIAKRVATGLASVEKNEADRKAAFDDFYEVLIKQDVVPAGRVLMGAGSDMGVTFFNCYVMPFIHDSRGGIARHREKVMEIMSRGGGVGTNGSTLRPRDTICHGVNGRSSGAVTWLHDLSGLTHLVEQGGSRRGAQMVMMNDTHPDIIEFIISKVQNPRVLRYIKENTTSTLIHNEVDRKLKFEPYKQSELNILESFLFFEKHHSEQPNQELIKEAEDKIKAGGVWSVHNPDMLTGANISVNLTKEFMDAVENDTDFELRFPDLDSYDENMRKIYDEEWDKCGDVREWEARGYGVKVYYTIKAKELWKLLNICATYSAEPGIFFIDNANDMTNAKAYGQSVVATNPCGEQPLSPWSVCNLSAINLANMTKDGQVDFPRLIRAAKVSAHLQDNVIDATPYFMEENTTQALGERRVGMGIMGLADLLIECELVYGSEEGNKVVDAVMNCIKLSAYEQSIELAQIKGSFPFLETLPNGKPNVDGRQKFINTGFMKTMPEYIRQGVLEHGIRNSHLLTVAPTGSTGTMVGVATGLEPYFSFVYYRSGRLGQFIPVIADIAVKWLEANGHVVTDDNIFELVDKLPEWFVGSMALPPEAHVDVQCIIQKHVDSSISKTVNAPKGYPVEKVQKVYEALHAGGAKGGTVYVDGSRDSQVLTLTADENDFDEVQFDEEVEIETVPIGTGVVNNSAVGVIKTDRPVGSDVGDTCGVCFIGELRDAGGCVTCDNCGAQTSCGL